MTAACLQERQRGVRPKYQPDDPGKGHAGGHCAEDAHDLQCARSQCLSCVAGSDDGLAQALLLRRSLFGNGPHGGGLRRACAGRPQSRGFRVAGPIPCTPGAQAARKTCCGWPALHKTRRHRVVADHGVLDQKAPAPLPLAPLSQWSVCPCAPPSGGQTPCARSRPTLAFRAVGYPHRRVARGSGLRTPRNPPVRSPPASPP